MSDKENDIKLSAQTLVTKFGKDALAVAQEIERMSAVPEYARAVTEEVRRLIGVTHH